MRYSSIRALDAALSALKLKDLHRLVTATGLAQTGTKAELLERLKPYIPTTVAGGDDGEGILKSRAKGTAVTAPKSGNRKKRKEKEHDDSDAVKPLNEVRREKKVDLVGHDLRGRISGASQGNASVRRERILSIDMGIQNLAFCVVDVELGGSTNEMHVVAWRRLAPMSFLPSASLSDRTSSALLYTSSNLALAAQSLLTRTLLPYGPTTILIEKQRYRTQGFAAVQEWTLRVNTLEAALWGVLAALRGGKEFDTSGYGYQNKEVVNGNHVIRSSGSNYISEGQDLNTNKDFVLKGPHSDNTPAREMAIRKEYPDVFAVSPGRVTGFWSAVLAEYNEEIVTSNDVVGIGGESFGAKSKGRTDEIKSRRKSPTIKSCSSKPKSPKQHKCHSDNSRATGINDTNSRESTSTPSSQPQNPFKLADKRTKVMFVKQWLITGRTSPFVPSTESYADSFTSPIPNLTDRNRDRSFQLSFAPEVQTARTAILDHGERRRQQRRKHAKEKEEEKGKAKDNDHDTDDNHPVGREKKIRKKKNDDDDVGDGEEADVLASASASASAGKVDDLADCMLQATAWARWKENEMMLGRGEWERLLRGRMG